MTGSVALDVVIGLIFIYLLYSLLASILQEGIATGLSFRAKILERGIIRMLQDNKDDKHFLTSWWHGWKNMLFRTDTLKEAPFAKAFFNHPFIKNLGEDRWYSKPSYLKAQNFSKVIIDLFRGLDISVGANQRPVIEENLKDGEFFTGEVASIKKKDKKDDNSKSEGVGEKFEAIKGRISTETHNFLKSLWIDAQGDIEKFKELLENWFDDTMARTTGWYKRYNQVCLLVVGFGIALFFNVDTIQIVKKLTNDPELRAQMVQNADTYLKAHPNLMNDIRDRQARIKEILRSPTQDDDTTQAKQDLRDLNVLYDKTMDQFDSVKFAVDALVKADIKKVNQLLALGWEKKCDGNDCNIFDLRPVGFSFPRSIAGWLITAAALSLGAPFWFDLLNKLMKLRGSIQTNASGSQTAKKSGEDKAKINRVG